MIKTMVHHDKYRLVMFVDDNNIDLLIGRKMVQLTNFASDVIAHSSADSALEYLRASADQPEHIPEVIFLDLSMPITSGFDFLDLFGELPSEIRKTSKIVILTSSSNPRDMAQVALYSTVTDILIKPLTPRLLEELKGKLVSY